MPYYPVQAAPVAVELTQPRVQIQERGQTLFRSYRKGIYDRFYLIGPNGRKIKCLGKKRWAPAGQTLLTNVFGFTDPSPAASRPTFGFCRRCNGLLTNSDSIQSGYGHVCLERLRRPT